LDTRPTSTSPVARISVDKCSLADVTTSDKPARTDRACEHDCLAE